MFFPITIFFAAAFLLREAPDASVGAAIETHVNDSIGAENGDPTVLARPAITLPAFTPVDIEILTPLNSKTSKMGDFFDIRLAEPIIVDGKILVPAGAVGKGEVIHAAKARAGGKAGEMILTARYVESHGQQLLLRSFKFGATTGSSKRDEALIAGALLAPAIALLISGGNVDVPAGTRAHAKTSEDNQLSQQEEK